MGDSCAPGGEQDREKSGAAVSHRTRAHARDAGRWAVGGAVALSVLLTGVAPATADTELPALTLVTLEGPGTAGTGTGAGTPADRAALLARQDRLLAAA